MQFAGKLWFPGWAWYFLSFEFLKARKRVEFRHFFKNCHAKLQLQLRITSFVIFAENSRRNEEIGTCFVEIRRKMAEKQIFEFFWLGTHLAFLPKNHIFRSFVKNCRKMTEQRSFTSSLGPGNHFCKVVWSCDPSCWSYEGLCTMLAKIWTPKSRLLVNLPSLGHLY